MGQSRQPRNQAGTFPQISAMWASTNRPVGSLRGFKPLSRSVIAGSPGRLHFDGVPHFVPRDFGQAHPNDKWQVEQQQHFGTSRSFDKKDPRSRLGAVQLLDQMM